MDNFTAVIKDAILNRTMEEPDYKCKYCGKGYRKESTLVAHLCEPKRRAMQENEAGVKLAMTAYLRFYEMTQGSAKFKTYADFSTSPYYNAFVKFGSFVNNVRPLYPEKYIDYVVTSGVKLDHWCRDALYEKYATELVLKESMETAIERSIQTMMDWATESEAPWNDYFRYASLNRVTRDIKDGKVSPWLILNCNSGKEMLSKFSDEQLGFVYEVIEPKHWALRFRRASSDVEVVKEVAKESKL